MPTKKKRVGFIPRSNVLEIIKKLSFESNLSTSKIINLLVEEALLNRGLFNKKIANPESDKCNNIQNSRNYVMQKNVLKENNHELKDNNHELKDNLLKNSNLPHKEVNYDPFDSEIYEQFLLFLKFQEKMKKRNF